MRDNQYVINNLSKESQEMFGEKFSGEAKKGQSSPKQAWVKALIYISLLEPDELSIAAYALWKSSQTIAARRRGGKDLRSLEMIQAKIYQEEGEFSTALGQYRKGERQIVNVAYRLSNLLYYQVQMYAKTGLVSGFMQSCQRYCGEAGIPILVAFDCACKKMLDRASRDEKDVFIEKSKIQQILINFGIS